MTQAVLAIKPWGHNLAVRLPNAVARAAHLQANQTVRVRVEQGRIVIEPLAAEPTLEERLQRYDPARHGGEQMAAAFVGAERW